MKFINKFIFRLLFLVPIFFSCTTHYIATMQDSDLPATSTNREFDYLKKDTIGVSYSFNNQNGSVRIRMENHSDQHMLINLNKSALTINGRASGFVNGKSLVYGRIGLFGTQNIPTTGIIDAVVENQLDKLHIPPKSYAESSFTNLHPDIRKLFTNNFEGSLSNYPLFDQPQETTIAFYQQQNSPLTISSYVNYSLLDANNNPKWSGFETQNFYLTSISKLKNVKKKTLRQELNTRNDMTGFSETKGGLWVLIGSLAGVSALLTAIGEPQ
ncbi:hypothetical protein [Lunatibacter salilacus]|uniref:hypothetical protein n=1 Tax=Lunatibacter salilacus TaxID=2483804 RepID=UPI00131E80C1|nr:hypothetical protein [Lunatibacter salilacus]